MAFIYDLSNEYGGVILADLGSPGAALSVNNNQAGMPAIGILSTASGSALSVSGIQGDAITAVAQDSNAVAGRFRSVASVGRAVIINRTVLGTASVAPILFAHPSTASGAVLGFGGCISVTSIVLTTVANFDYVIPIEINGEARYIPVVKAAGVVGAAVPA